MKKFNFKNFIIYIVLIYVGFHFLSTHYSSILSKTNLAICFSPFFAFLAINILKVFLKKNVYLSSILSILAYASLCFITVYFFFLEICFFFGNIKPEEPRTIKYVIAKENYKEALEGITQPPYRTEHFPLSIPKNANEYYCRISDNLNFNYLTFKTDKSYIDNLIKKNKNNILVQDSAKKICKHYIICERYEDTKDDDTIYILKQKQNDDDYTSGFIVSKNKDKILFFFGDSPLTQIYYSLDTIYPALEDYVFTKKILNNPHRFKHFPNKISENMSNYFFRLFDDPRGWDVNYLSVNTDKEYISNLLKSQEHNIIEKINFATIDKYYRNLSCDFDIKNDEVYTVYILKNENNDENYTSGMVISEEESRVIFFYSNYNLKRNNE